MDVIWRVENSKGEGCYRDERTKRAIDWTDDFNPLPRDDKGIERETEEGEIYGFVSLEQVEKWFSATELERLAKLGFELKEVEVKEISAFGERQIIAIR